MTGRAAGYCAGYSVPGYMNPIAGGGFWGRGMGGIGRIIGPTGGYLLGYLPAVFIVGYISEKGNKRILWDIVGMLAGTIILYACGVTWLKTLTGMPWPKTLAVGMLPFLIGDALKIAAAAAIAKALRPIIRVTPDANHVTRTPQPATRNP